MSNAMLEEMASGLQIITTRCEGVDELIDANGIVVDKDDVNEIAEAVRKLIEDMETYKQMSIAARKRAKSFNWQHVSHLYMQPYEEILKSLY